MLSTPNFSLRSRKHPEGINKISQGPEWKTGGGEIKTMRKILIAFFLLMAVSNCLAEEEKPKQVESDQLSQTVITSYVQSDIVEGKNLMYCSTFQIAWDVLSDDIIKEPLRLNGNPLMAQMLNERLTGKEDISEDCYLAMAGLNKDGIVEKIKQALKEKFNEEPGLDISLRQPDDILAYAFLLKDLKFAKEFEGLDQPIYFRDKTSVKAFGIEQYAFDEKRRSLGEQVSILDYQNDDDFIISLKSVSPKDEIILAKIVPQKTMLETMDSVFNRISSARPSVMAKDETLRIPKLDFDVLHSYTELSGRAVLNKGFEKYFISKAIQSIRFRLNEKGALLRSEAAIEIAMGISRDIPKRPRLFIFDKPFLICLKEKGAKYPYFSMWVDNAELLLQK